MKPQKCSKKANWFDGRNAWCRRESSTFQRVWATSINIGRGSGYIFSFFVFIHVVHYILHEEALHMTFGNPPRE